MILRKADKKEQCYSCGGEIPIGFRYVEAETDNSVKLHIQCWFDSK